MPYEKIGKNEPVCIADEVPFEIPESWEWCRLGTLMSVISDGTHKTSNYVESGVPFLSVQNISKGYFDLTKIKYISREEHEKLIQRVKPQLNDILICRIGTLGKAIKCTVEFEFSIFVSLGLLRPVCSETADFIIFTINSPLGDRWIQENKVGGGTHTYKINLADIPNMLIPIPPQEEQERIFEKISELDSSLTAYDDTEKKLSILSESFPTELKKSILQQAIMGKLVPQDPNDEPAIVLLERIREEKNTLIKAGKLKKDKHESVIYRRDNSHYEKLDGVERCIDDEIPFEIPETWQWFRLGSIVYNHGQVKPEEDFSYIDIGSIDNAHQKLNTKETIITAEKAPSRARKIVQRGDIIYSTVRPYLHNMCIIDREFSHMPIASTGFAVIACYNGIFNEYLFYYLLSPIFDAYANDIENSKGVAYPAINDEKLYRALVAVPPNHEQIRIVEQLKISLLPLNSI